LKATAEALADAMRRLFVAEKIQNVTEGPPSRLRTKIVEAEGKPTFSATPSTDQKANNDGPGREQETSSAVTTGTSAPSTDPSTDLPPPSTGVCSPPPLIPPKAGGTAKRAVEAPGRPPAFPEERSKGLGGSPPPPETQEPTSPPASEPRPPQSTNSGEIGVRHCAYCGQRHCGRPFASWPLAPSQAGRRQAPRQLHWPVAGRRMAEAGPPPRLPRWG